MLPSRGFFKKNDCPFYEKGLCERPHCHFRHRKKVVSENSSGGDSQDLIIPKDVHISLDDTVNAESDTTQSKNTVNASSNDAKKSISSSSEEEQPKQDSLFAKLVNQVNPYEKISRHIPCAYTPTPQHRGVQPKHKSLSSSSSVSAKNSLNSLNSSKAMEILAKTQSYSDSFSSVNNRPNVSTYVPSSSQDLMSAKNDVTDLGKSNEQPNIKYTIDSISNKACEFKNSFDGKDLNSLSYDPLSMSKSIINNLGKNNTEGSTSDYVPSRVTIPESQYTPYTSSSSLPNNYVPSKENKPQTVQYVPEASVSTKIDVAYKPSEKCSSGETQYQPESSDEIACYVPTEKSATNGNVNKDETWTELEFISSEIEMMKKLLTEDDVKESTEEITSKTETLNESKKKDEEKEKKSSSRSHHSSSSRHKLSSSHGHSSSKSKSSSSSKHSSHRSRSSSSSSRHHSSSHKSKSSSEEQEKRSESEGRKKSSSSSHKSSRHHSSHKSHKRSKEKREKESDLKDRKKQRISGSSDEDHCKDDQIPSEREMSNSENENSESKKRKKSWDSDDRDSKIFKSEEGDLLAESEEDPDAIEKECLEIFNSYTNNMDNDSGLEPQFKGPSGPGTEDYENSGVGKKRTAHATSVMSDHSVLRHKTAKKTHSIRSAQEVMLERYKIIEKAKETAASPTIIPSIAHVAPISGLNRPAIRIAAVSNIQQMLNAKKAIEAKIGQGLKVNERTTIAQTIAPKRSRVAHMPVSKAIVEKPIIYEGSKQVPTMKRQIYLDKLLLETNQIYPTKEESVQEAMKIEEDIFRAHSGSFPAYHTAYISALMKTRRRISALKGEVSSSSATRTKVSHSVVLAGGKKNFSVLKSKKVDISMLSDRHIYEELLRCKLTQEQLKENSYPMDGKKPGYATCLLNMELKYNSHYSHIKKMTGNRRYCIRCSKQYEVDPETLRQYKEGPETCSYHPGKKKSGGRNSERIYNCCNSSSTEGCATHVRHVTDCNDYENLPNCVKTFPKKHETNPGIFALDCEMVYTRLGYELARVTVVNLKKEVVYDTLVKPKYPVDCYNTFYSGIEEKMLEGVKTTLKDVQAVLLNMFSDKTILIGHSLDSDLRALHLIHDTVVDTSVVYKNEKYHPYKYSLKDLCARKISKIIQDNVGGHDSAEDATAALEIMLNHVKEEVSKYDSLESYEADRMT